MHLPLPNIQILGSQSIHHRNLLPIARFRISRVAFSTFVLEKLICVQFIPWIVGGGGVYCKGQPCSVNPDCDKHEGGVERAPRDKYIPQRLILIFLQNARF
ncbi:hypothetical protein CEXT_532661 [Caerostris extrusa]|uniref:Uncharacterized protein n=1 Tax=Caerostris extrusa TaxID=172846 RepID=A0AAV4X502_CAEEX|nr:hypothetical protein CEXT_532661 [Caerostris extrusa]